MSESEQRVHHPYSPSTLQNLEACPCYKGRESKHERTAAGTLAHKVTETLEDDQKLGDEDAEAAAACIDFYERRKQLMEEARVRGYFQAGKEKTYSPIADSSKLDFPKLIELRETYLPVDSIEFPDGVLATTAGYVDRALISHDLIRAELFDWKFGMWAVEDAKNNLQGIAYSLGLFKAYPTVQEVTFHFFQPHIELISSAMFKRDQIPALYLRVQVVVARAREARKLGDFSTASPAIPVCNFCAHIGTCPKVTDFACKVGAKFYPLEIPENITPTMVHSPQNTSLGLRLAQVVKIWADAFKTQVTDRVFRGKAEMPAGFGIQSRADREIIDREKFKSVALQYVTEKEYEDCLDIAFGPIESKIGEKSPRGSKAAQIQDFKKRLEETGAVKKGEPYHFLKASSSTKDK